MAGAREPVNTGAMEPGKGAKANYRQLAGREGEEAAEQVLAGNDESVVTRETTSGARTEDRSVPEQGEPDETEEQAAARQAEHERASAANLSQPAQGEHTRRDLEAKSADDLRQMAAERGIEGRSNMNKAQLVDALSR